MESTVFLAEYVCRKAHVGQYRRDGVTPYWNHPRDVARRVTTDEEKIVAYLHDVLEDTDYTPERLVSEGIPSHLVDVVQLLTKTEGVPYDTYISNIKQNKIATNVKIADMLSNLSDTPSIAQIQRYAKALLVLTNH